MDSTRTPAEVPGDKALYAAQELLPLVYADLRRLAAQKLMRLPPGQTLQPTALVHEAWLRLAKVDGPSWANQAHFFAAAAQAMRRIVIEQIRRKACLKRGGSQERLDVDVDELAVAGKSPEETLLLINEALERLEIQDPVKAKVVVLKFFGGLTDSEVASTLEVTERTVERYWAFARAWLMEEMQNR